MTFNENLHKVKASRGFVLQIQKDTVREKSPMLVAQEMQSGWLQVPRIGYFAFANKVARGGTDMAEEYMGDAIAAARAQWEKGVCKCVEMVSEVFEAVEGELCFNEIGEVQGLARCTWPNGCVYEGSWLKNQKHGHGAVKYADGASYVGQYENGLKHGLGTYKWADGEAYCGDFANDTRHGRGAHTYANGNVYVGFYEAGQRKGPGVSMQKGLLFGYWLMKDGEKEREISRAEAGKSDLRDVFGVHSL